MDMLLNAFRRFIARDLVFIISGGAVVGTFLYLFDRLPTSSDSWVIYALLAGVGYFTAYATQEVFCVFHLITTTPVAKPSSFVQWLYERYDRKSWQPIGLEPDEARQRFTDEEQWAEFQRIVTLQLVGTAGGSSIILCGLMFLLKWWLQPNLFHLTVAFAGVLLGALLICLSWLKGAQRAHFVATYVKGEEKKCA